MKLAILTKVSLGILLAWGASAHAEVAGRVLVSVGDTSAVRAGKEIKLAAGTPIETGDTLRVGDVSNLQVRFTDEAIMALRSNTTMRIDDYAFANKAESDKSVFSLLKGGLRTITGIIGRNSRSNYAVKAETSTIGIRGTHFNIVHCSNDCRNTDGSAGQNGTFGAVTDGRISVTNKAGEREFGKSEFFFVASQDALPQGLIAPPGFLRDRLDGQAKTKGKDKAQTAAGGAEGATPSANTAGATQPAMTTNAPVLLTQSVTEFVPADQPKVTELTISDYTWIPDFGPLKVTSLCTGYPCTLTTSALMARTGSYAGITYVNYSGTSYAYPFSGTDGEGGAVLNGSVTLTAPPPYRLPDHYYTSYPNFTSSQSLTLTPVEWGSSTVGNMQWVRMSEVGTETWSYTNYSGGQVTGTDTWKGWDHGIMGDAAIPLPTSGSYTYNWIGGTTPTDSLGNVGTLTSGGSWNVNFGGSSMTVATVSPVQWSVGGVSYQLAVSSQSVSLSPQSVSGYNHSGTGIYPQLSGTLTCAASGGCSSANVVSTNSGSTATNTISPTFFGAGAAAMGVGYVAGATAGGVTRTSAHAQAYTK